MNMKVKTILFFLCLCCLPLQAQETYLYAHKDTTDLYLDIHRPSSGVSTAIEGVQKPTILYLFGGGFISGARNDGYLLKWFQILNDNGYTVVSIDYRLGMKGYKMGKGLVGLAQSVQPFYTAQQMGVEDVFSAVTFLAEHPELGIDIRHLVLSGNSAGAIISLSCLHTLANGQAKGIPEGFCFAGVISFAGAIISTHGAPRWPSVPCPVLFFHGMKDNAVAYRHFGAFGKGMWGSSYWVDQFRKKGANYSIYRYVDRAHDVAAYMSLLWPEEQAFLEKNVMQGVQRIVDATVDDPSLPVWKNWGSLTPQEMYK